MMNIFSYDRTLLLSVPVTQPAEHEEELMKSDFVRLSWDSDKGEVIPTDSYIVYNDVEYRLFEPYTPEQKGIGQYHYEPLFQHPKMYIGKVPFVIDSKDAEAKDHTYLDWQFTGFVSSLLEKFCEAINNALGLTEDPIVAVIIGEIDETVSLSFSASDIMSCLTQAANNLKCEWHLDYEMRKLYFGHIMIDRFEPIVPILEVGVNIGTPSIRSSKEGYWNAYLAQGSTRNITRRAATGEDVQSMVRLTLDKEKYPDGTIYTLGEIRDGLPVTYTREQIEAQGLKIYMKSLIFEDVFPRLDLYVYDCRYRERYLEDENIEGDDKRVVDYYDSNNNPVYKRYAQWYIRLAYPIYNADGKTVDRWEDYVIDGELIAEVSATHAYRSHGRYVYGVETTMEFIAEMYTGTPIVDEGDTCYLVTLKNGERVISAMASESVNGTVFTFGELHDTENEALADETAVAFMGGSDDVIIIDGVDNDKAPAENVRNSIVAGKRLYGQWKANTREGAETSPLAGRGDGDNGNYGFEFTPMKEGKVIPADVEKGDTGVVIKAGDYRIEFQQNDDVIIPTTISQGIIPKGVKDSGHEVTDLNALENKTDGLKGNIVNLYNIVMSDSYIRSAQAELEAKTFKEIVDTFTDNNSYSFKALETVFYQDKPDLYIGRKVIYKNGDYTLDTRVMKIVTKLDYDFQQEITVGNEVLKGNQQQLSEKVETLVSAGANGAGGGSMSLSALTRIISSWVTPRFLSKLGDDTTIGNITMEGIISHGYSLFEDGLTALGVSSFQDFVEMLGQVIFGSAIQSRNFVSSFNGWAIDILGNAEFESVKVRSALEVLELLINRMQAQEGDTLFTDNDQIEAVEKRTDPTDGSVSYILSLKEKWEGYITPQQYGNILKGIINTLAAKEAGVSDYEGQTVETDGSNSYYTSWMRVIATHNTDANLGVNQIRVVLYGDTDEQGKPIVPAGKNYEPCQLMTVGRWGCIDYSSEYEGTAEYEAVKRSIEKRQRLFLISTSDGRMMKLTGVDAPILKNGNYGFSLGELPEFVAAYPSVRKRMIPGLDYLYAQGIVVQDFIKIDKEGLPEVTRIDCGEWVDGADLISKGETPRPRYGIYLVGELNEDSGWNESHDVWHEGHKWRCLQHQPVISGGVQNYYEPKWNSPYWLMIEGNDNLTIEFVSSKGYSFRRGAVDTVITPHLFYGNVDITDDVAAEYWNWTRESESGKTVQDETWDAQHQQQKTLSLTNTDMPSTWSTRDKAIFTCTVTLNDGKTTRIVQNQIIS